MKKTFYKIPDLLFGRVARNIYFLLVVLVPKITSTPHKYIGISILLDSISLILLYLNNFVLVPYLLAKKRYLLYFPIALVTAAAFALIYAYLQSTPIAIAAGEGTRVLTPGGHKLTFSEIWAFMLLVNIFQIIIFTVLWYLNDYQRKRAELTGVKKKQMETELAFLKGQLNPHFLFNTLNNLYGLALKKADNTPDAILELSLILRYLLYESDTQFVMFEKEKGIMEAYIKLELLRLSDSENFKFHIYADKPYNIPPLLWLPVLENIFKHGTRYITDDLTITYNCTIEQDRMHIHAENTYKADIKHIEEKNGGIGLENLHKRLALLYPGKHQINVTQTNDLYITDIQISLA